MFRNCFRISSRTTYHPVVLRANVLPNIRVCPCGTLFSDVARKPGGRVGNKMDTTEKKAKREQASVRVGRGKRGRALGGGGI